MSSGSGQKRVGKIRGPRVHIEYDVQIGDAQVKKHIPFLVGVVGDYSGTKPRNKLKPLRERKFVEINRDNFNDVLKSISPEIVAEVPNMLDNDGTMIKVDVTIESMEDFSPRRVAEQVEPLKNLLAIRDKLSDLKTKIDVSTELSDILGPVLKNTEDQRPK